MGFAKLSRSLQLAAFLWLAVAVAFGANATSSLTAGTPDPKSAGQLAFGPDGVLFVGDALGAAVFALDTQDTQPAASAGKIEVKAINEKIAAMLGTTADQILINDVKVNPISKKIYLSVSRGRGPDAGALILRIDRTGKISEFSLDHIKFSTVSMPDAPESDPSAAPKRSAEGQAAGNPRAWTITDMSYVDGKVIVAGVSNEEFSSDLRSIPFPFHGAEKGSAVEIWHSQHGRYESQAPVRTFIPYKIDQQQYILATYACTPLVKMPVSALKPGVKVEGETIAELGEHNTPLEMFPYHKEGHDYLLVANSLRGVMKVSADSLGMYKPIVPPTPLCAAQREVPTPTKWSDPATVAKQTTQTKQTKQKMGPKECSSDIAGVPYETIPTLKGVLHMARADDTQAVMLIDSAQGDKVTFTAGVAGIYTPDLKGSVDLKTIVLP
jgi:hypothetical protein